MSENINTSNLEIVEYLPKNNVFKAALFDFDGTLSLIRSGWQSVMVPYFAEEFISSVGYWGMTEQEITSLIKNFVDELTGKQTIFQCLQLKTEIEQRGGKAKDEMEYKNEYLRRLYVKIADKKRGLADGTISPEKLLVNGSIEFLKSLQDAGISLYCASGTDQPQVREEAKLLGLEKYFGENIFGALDEQVRQCSKELVIKRLIEESHLKPEELLSFGDGFVEIESVTKIGGYSVGVATNENDCGKVDSEKRIRLIKAGAKIIVPDFSDYNLLAKSLLSM